MRVVGVLQRRDVDLRQFVDRPVHSSVVLQSERAVRSQIYFAKERRNAD